MRSVGLLAIPGILLLAVTAGSPVAPSVAAAHTPAIPSDFDGDGYADLAIGAIGEAVGTSGSDAGSVNVLYGSSHGLTAAGDQVWTQDSPGIKGSSEGRKDTGCCDGFGTTLVSGDFDSDGYADLAIGAEGERHGGVRGFGVVNVISGSPNGLTATGDLYLTAPKIVPKPWVYRQFGRDMASGDINGDGFDDLLVGATVDSGEYQTEILLGSGSGLHESAATFIDSAGPMAIGDLDGDGFDDVAIRHPVGPVAGVEVRYGTASGLSTTRIEIWNQDSPGIDDETEIQFPDDETEFERFGLTVSIGDFDDDGFGDLAIGTPNEIGEGGAVNIIPGSAAGLTSVGSQFWHAGIAGLPAMETWRGFGSAIAAGDLDGDGDDDLVVGGVHAPGLSPQDGGAILTILGGPDGLTSDGSRLFWQNTPGIPGVDEPGDLFGCNVSAADFDGSGEDDIAIGSELESFGGIGSAGLVTIIKGTSSGPSAIGARSWSQDSPGVRGRAERQDRFGTGLSPISASVD